MKKHLSTIVLLSGLVLTGCNNGETPLAPSNPVFSSKEFTSIRQYSNEYFALSTYNLVLNVDETYQIEVSSMPKVADDSVLVYTSKDSKVATVSATGLVKGIAKGITEIEVKTSDGKCSEKMNVFIGETTDKSTSLAYLNTVHEYQEANPDKRIKKVWAHEVVYQGLSKNGVPYNESKFVEDFYWSEEDAYFEIYSDDLAIKTENGAVSAEHGKWKFFVDKDSYVTFLCHETPNAKNYMEVATQSYIGQNASNIIYDILEMFFVSGKSIVTDYVNDINATDFVDPAGYYYDIISQNYSNVTLKLSSAGENTLCLNSKIDFEDETISSSDEFSLEIPTGTKYDASQRENFMMKDNMVIGAYYENEMVFKDDYNGGGVTRKFSKDLTYSTEFELEIPDLKTFNRVDSIYDL